MSAAESPALGRLRLEIAEQPAVVERVLVEGRPAVRRFADALRQASPRAIVLVARGSSDHAAIYGRYLFEICNHTLTSLAAPSQVTLYDSGPNLAGCAVIGISQSGQGEDVTAYLRAARAQGALTAAIVNDPASPLAQAAEHVLDCLAGPELSIPATKTVTAQMAVLASLSATLLGEAEVPRGSLPDALRRALNGWRSARMLAGALADTPIAAVIGRGFAYPAALEIALKLKETSYTRAEPFSAADFIHGPVALVDASFMALVVDVGGRSSAAAAEVAAAIQARGGAAQILRVGPSAFDGLAVQAAVSEPYAPIPAVVLGQLFAVELALARGLDPALPRGLAKVTSTR